MKLTSWVMGITALSFSLLSTSISALNVRGPAGKFVCISLAMSDKDSADNLKQAIEDYLRELEKNGTDITELVWQPTSGLFTSNDPKFICDFLNGVNRAHDESGFGAIGYCKCPPGSELKPSRDGMIKGVRLNSQACLIDYNPPTNPKFWPAPYNDLGKLYEKWCSKNNATPMRTQSSSFLDN